MKRLATIALTPVVRFVEWLFGPRAPGIDLWLGLFSAGWAWLMVTRPHIFDKSPFSGMNWLPDAAWVALFAALALAHGLGLANPLRLALRQAACLASAWIWISVSASMAAIEITTGVLTYANIGFAGLAGAIYLSGQPRKVG